MLGEIPLSGLSRERNSSERVPAAITDVGCEREINEDRYAVVDSPAGRSWLVCDGMGGALGGELAAQLAIDAIRRALESGSFEDGEEALRVSIEEANRIETAIANVLDRGLRTGDIMSEGCTRVGTVAMGDAIIEEIKSLYA